MIIYSNYATAELTIFIKIFYILSY